MSSQSEALSRIEAFGLMSPRDLDALRAAAQRGDAEAVRSEGHQWSGRIALAIFELADLIHPDTQEQP